MSIHVIPSELLSAIFASSTDPLDPTAHYFQEFITNRHDLIASVSLVCRFWRSVVVSTQELWSLVVVHELFRIPPERMKLRLARAGVAGLNVIINFNIGRWGTDEFEDLRECMGCVRASAAQWRTLSVLLSGAARSADDLFNFLPTSLPNLVDFALWMHARNINDIVHSIDAPKLQRFVSPNIPIFPFRNLISLHSVDTTSPLDSHFWKNFVLALSQTTIQELHLSDRNGVSSLRTAASDWPTLPSLRHLHLHLTTPSLEQDFRVICSLNAPLLTTLVLKGLQPRYYKRDDSDPLLANPFPVLSRITIPTGNFVTVQRIIGKLNLESKSVVVEVGTSAGQPVYPNMSTFDEAGHLARTQQWIEDRVQLRWLP